MNVTPSFRAQSVTVAESKSVVGCQPLKPETETAQVTLKPLDKDTFESSEKKEDGLKQSSEKSRVSFGFCEKAIQKVKSLFKSPAKVNKKA